MYRKRRNLETIIQKIQSMIEKLYMLYQQIVTISIWKIVEFDDVRLFNLEWMEWQQGKKGEF